MWQKEQSKRIKNIIACLQTTNKNLPLHLWDRILPQAIATLNLLRSSCLNPRLSAEEHLNGTFDFHRKPPTPLGMKVIIHDEPAKRRSWASNGLDGWYVGHAPEHYWCYKIFVTATAATRVSDTVKVFPRLYQMPRTSLPMPPDKQHAT
jgi:hypothetical protein